MYDQYNTHYYNIIIDIIDCYIDKIHKNLYYKGQYDLPFDTIKIHNVWPPIAPKRSSVSLLKKLKKFI